MSIVRSLKVGILTILLAACSSAPAETDVSLQESHPTVDTDAQTAISPRCKAGCVDPDPAPNAPGVSLGFAVSPTECLYGDTADQDVDGLSDYCEQRLADAFAPLMRYNAQDDVRRQGYWAARPDGEKITIIYMIGYYLDHGVVAGEYPGCVAASVFGLLASCDGHVGDSENVILTVYYNTTTQHWVLESVKASYHNLYNNYSRGSNAYPTQFVYSQFPGRYPTIWVAHGKHANYKSQAECDAGNGGGDFINFLFSFDDCTGNNSYFRAEAAGNRNVGSSTQNLLNCVLSTDPMYQNPPRAPECLWATNGYFHGWQLEQTGTTTPYGTILRANGY